MSEFSEKIFITGGTGYIGSLLVNSLLSQGKSLRLLYLHENEIQDIARSAKLELIKGNILDLEGLKSALKGCTHVYHLAGYAKNYAKNSKLFFDINQQGTKNLILASQHVLSVKKIVITSTIVTFGPTLKNQIGNEEMPRSTMAFFTEYEESKYLSELDVAAMDLQPLEVVFVNPTRVFGPGKLTEGNSVSMLIRDYLAGKFPILLGDGSAVGNYVYVADLVNGFILAMEHGKHLEKYILGGDNISLKEFFKLIDQITHKSRLQVPVPALIVLIFSYFELFRAKYFNHYPLITPGWVKTFLADWTYSTQKAQTKIFYKVTPLKQALTQTIDWIKSHEFKK